MHPLERFSASLKSFLRSTAGRRLAKVLRAGFVMGVAGWLVYQLSDIGWAEVWASRPRTVWYYVLWLGLYLQLPLVEVLIYRGLWGLSLRELLPPILRKRALNQDVVSYSGEAYFFLWARQRLGLPDRAVAATLKDNAIVSSLASWTASILLISVFLFTGQIVLTDLIGEQDPVYITTAVIVAGALAALIVRFRNTLFWRSPRAILALFLTYLGRFMLFSYVLQILQWWVVLPETPFSVWATMLAVLTFINRVPLIPAKDLVGIGAVLGMADLLAASHAAIAAMLLMRSALDKLMNLALFAGMHLFDRKRAGMASHEEQALAGPAENPAEPMFVKG